MILSPDEATEEPAEPEPAEPEEPTEPLPVLTTAQLYAQRQHKLAERKQRIALLASAVMENPEENVSYGHFVTSCFENYCGEIKSRRISYKDFTSAPKFPEWILFNNISIFTL